MRIIRPSNDSAPAVPTASAGIEKGAQNMARRKVKRGHRLSLEAQLKGVRAALRSQRTPPQLKEGLRKRADQLEGELGRKKEDSGLLGIGVLGL